MNNKKDKKNNYMKILKDWENKEIKSIKKQSYLKEKLDSIKKLKNNYLIKLNNLIYTKYN